MLSEVAMGTVMLADVALSTLVRHQPSSTNTSSASPGAGLPESASSCGKTQQRKQQHGQQRQQSIPLYSGSAVRFCQDKQQHQGGVAAEVASTCSSSSSSNRVCHRPWSWQREQITVYLKYT
jgi:hypothetical protein